eukprot:1156748-Pelagomonas_calceolata.AAC.10
MAQHLCSQTKQEPAQSEQTKDVDDQSINKSEVLLFVAVCFGTCVCMCESDDQPQSESVACLESVACPRPLHAQH